MATADAAMTEKELPPRKRVQRIKDARGRKVTQLDPVAMHLLRQPGVIDTDVLRAIAQEDGLRIRARERAALVVGLLGAILVIGLFTAALFTRDIRHAPLAKSSGLIYLCSIPFIVWYGMRRARFSKVAAVMLKYLRCPHCGYDLRHLPVDRGDGVTVCPECGCAWRLPDGGSPKTTRLDAGPTADSAGSAAANRHVR